MISTTVIGANFVNDCIKENRENFRQYFSRFWVCFLLNSYFERVQYLIACLLLQQQNFARDYSKTDFADPCLLAMRQSCSD